MIDAGTDEFHDVGYVLLRRFFDPLPLIHEVDRSLIDGADIERRQTFTAGRGTVSLVYVPMMCDRTPVSLALSVALAAVAEELLGRAVLPGRAKGTRYFGDTSWHRDSEHGIASVGCLAYLDPVTAPTGALRVVPGSHENATVVLPDAGYTGGAALETQPGDVIIFDEHLVHGSSGGRERRQWRTDFVVDPNQRETPAVQEWYAQSLPDEQQEVGYDAHRYPSFGQEWRARQPVWAQRLVGLKVLGRGTVA